MKPYQITDHTADIGLEIFGDDLPSLFTNAAFALFDLIIETELSDDGSLLELHVRGEDPADLLINWLRELLYLWNGEERLIRSADIQQLTSDEVRAVLRVIAFNPEIHCISEEIKAVTYHRAQVEKTSEGWRAYVVLDV